MPTRTPSGAPTGSATCSHSWMSTTGHAPCSSTNGISTSSRPPTCTVHATRAGLSAVAHAGEEGPPEYIWQAGDVLGAQRIDRGVRCLEDRRLVQRLGADRIPLTVCPFSNVKLRVVKTLEQHPLAKMV